MNTASSPALAPSLLQRVQAILLRPRETWSDIAVEDGDIARIYKGYLIYLAAIPAVAGFIGQSLVGIGAFGFSVRIPIIQGLVSMVVGYALSLAMVYVLALIANALAPKFQGQQNLPSAFKLVAYGATAGMVGGIFSAVPSLSMLGLLAALYSIYLIYTGIPVLMQAPQDKAIGYTVALVVCGIVAGILIGLLTSLVTPGGIGGTGPRGPVIGSASPGVSITVPGTDIKIDTSRIEAASREMEKAQASGDSQAAGKALGDMMGAALGGQGGAPFPPETLRGFVPDKLAGMTRSRIEARSDSAMGIQISSVSAQYTADNQELEIEVQDVGAVPALAMAMTAWSRTTMESETDGEVERVYRRGDIAIKERYQKDGSASDVALLLPNGVMLQANGSLPVQQLHEALSTLGLDQLARLKRPS